MKPVGHIMTGVQKTIFLSLTAALDSFKGIFEAADDTDPSKMLLVSLITDN